MRGLVALFGVLLLIGIVVKFFWWIVLVVLLVLAAHLVRDHLGDKRAGRAADARQKAAIAARADQQHRWALEGDLRGTYGQYLAPRPRYRRRGSE